MVNQKEQEFKLVITADNITSTDKEFTMNNLRLGDCYRAEDIVFINKDGEKIGRDREKGEHRSSNQKVPRLACQIFEKQLQALSDKEKEDFPVCRYSLTSEVIRGIFPSKEAFNEYENDFKSVEYTCDDGSHFYLFCWNVFSTLIFVQECLKRFGQKGEKFILTYKRVKDTEAYIEDEVSGSNGPIYYLNSLSNTLLASKNVIFRGAPGTGKSYLAKEIAADIISEGHVKDYASLTDEQKKQVEFVQFHPSYDYADFVEGLRPKVNDDQSLSFQLEDGIFTKFVKRAQKNFDDAHKSPETIQEQTAAADALNAYLSDIEFGEDEFSIFRGTKFYITGVDDKHIYISIPDNPTVKSLNLKKSELFSMLESGQDFQQFKDLTEFFGKQRGSHAYSYDLAIFKDLKSKNLQTKKPAIKPEKIKPFIFIIDEINRAEISKVLGELFFAIDPGYRGQPGEVATQFASMHDNPDDKFFVPENVYIIGTMNDIDRSVESFDFAMRRRFRFIEIKAEERLEMLDCLGDELKQEAVNRMASLNQAISTVDDLNENYHVGVAYFLKLKDLSFDQLWTDYLLPLLQDYVRGLYDEEAILQDFAHAYNSPATVGDNDGNAEG